MKKPFIMKSDSDYDLAQLISKTLQGKFWQVTAGDWWVVVEGVSSQKLVILTNDPFGACFTPSELTISLKDLKQRVMKTLLDEAIIYEDGSWAVALAS